MIERKRGRVVSISSLVTSTQTPLSTAYCASKFGINGFMRSLQHDMFIDDYDEFITFTNVYPDFMNTRQELMDVLNKLLKIAIPVSPEIVADETVKGMLYDKQDVIATKIKFGHFLFR
jgi:short-subunit dehydrogenase